MSGAELPLWAAWLVVALAVVGAAFSLTGALGLIRLRTFYERVHAPTLGATIAPPQQGMPELATAIRDDPQVREARSALLAMLESLIDAAQAEGTLRRDVAPGDVIQLLALLKRRPVVPDDVAGRVRERTRALLLEALRADGRGALPGEPVRVEEFFDRA